MKLADYLTKRVLAWFAIAVLSAVFGSARAHSLATTCPNVTPRVCDEGQAVSDIVAQQEHKCADLGLVRWSTSTITNVNATTKGGTAHCRESDGTGGSNWGSNNAIWSGTCLARPDLGNLVLPVEDENVFEACSTGCKFIDNDSTIESYSANGQLYIRVEGWLATGDTCTVGEPPVDPPDPDDTDGDGTPDYLDDFPDDPTETTDSDGDGIGDNADVAPLDPTNGVDGGQPPPPPPSPCGGAGQPPCTGPGDESDNVASGGGTCDAPPFCSGDGIQCNQLFQQWKARCIAEGHGAKLDGIKGAIEGLGEGEGDGNTPGVPGGVPTGEELYEGTGKTAASVYSEFQTRVMESPLIGAATGFFNADGLSGTCPTFTLTMFSRNIVLDFFCLAAFQQIFVWLGWFVLASFTWYAFKIGFLD